LNNNHNRIELSFFIVLLYSPEYSRKQASKQNRTEQVVVTNLIISKLNCYHNNHLFKLIVYQTYRLIWLILSIRRKQSMMNMKASFQCQSFTLLFNNYRNKPSSPSSCSSKFHSCCYGPHLLPLKNSRFLTLRSKPSPKPSFVSHLNQQQQHSLLDDSHHHDATETTPP
jgi:hypothetical protein